jgi:hypothetical protein
MKRVGICLASILFWGWAASAQGALPVGRVVAEQVLAANTARVETLKRLAEGNVSEAIEYWVLATGKEAPAWLLATRTAFEASKQAAGACQGVAQTLHTAFTRLGGRPEFVQLTTRAEHMVFRMPGGKDMMLTDASFHVVVRLNGRAYDAFTGAAGMPWTEYFGRLGAYSPIIQKVAENTVRQP